MSDSKLAPFEGRPVVRSSVRITKAGDGLSDALKFAPVALHHDDEVFFVLKGVVSQVNHKPEDRDSDELVRVQTVEAVEIAMVDEADVTELLASAAERVRRSKEEALKEDGIFPLPIDGSDDAILAAHDAGEHDELVDGCAACDEERTAVAAESKAKAATK